MTATALQEDWDEEQDPECFRLGGSVPQARAKPIEEAGASCLLFLMVLTSWLWICTARLALCGIDKRAVYCLHTSSHGAESQCTGI